MNDPLLKHDMLSYLRDKLSAATLRARYERLANERLLTLLDEGQSQPIDDDRGWHAINATGSATSIERRQIRDEARRLVRENPHAKNILRLLEIYVAGPQLRLMPEAMTGIDIDAEVIRAADRHWQSFLAANCRHFSYREFTRRVWRDGECFLRLYAGSGLESDFGPTVRFVDPETIGDVPGHPPCGGIITSPDDIESPIAYLRIDATSGELLEEIAADEILHSQIGVDSNEQRGVSLFAPLIDPLDRHDKWLDTELTARPLQSSIVLWRKVHGSPGQVRDVAESVSESATGGSRRERVKPGTILTTSRDTTLEFLQPKTNFGDAVPLGRSLLLSIAAGAGLPEFMLTSDASNANFSSTMVAEGPAVKLFEAEQQFFAGEFNRLWRWVLLEAERRGELPDGTSTQLRPKWSFPQLVNRDRAKDRDIDTRMAEAGILSRAEVARRDGVDPETMREEMSREVTSEE
ncbi:phage portal protein [Stratiformator vulcanicus]|uniref:phage portal protein n=1 Tax=Stratiformator vulcanicus TaxID=2527980 RepID=UPI0011A2A2C4|nr:phage portal protein [Stratiformator vulcanicus]